MPGIRDIKRRIKSVRSIQKITRAMHMVAAAKLRRARELAEGSRDYALAQRRFAEKLAAAAAGTEHPFVRGGDGPGLYLVITGDRGLSGGYNSNILKAVTAHMEQHPGTMRIIVAGQKGASFFTRRGNDIVHRFTFIGEEVSRAETREIAALLHNTFTNESCSAVFLAYTEFVTVLKQQPVVKKLLPVEPREKRRVEVEPSAARVIEKFMFHYIWGQVHTAMLEAKASETAARMTAMESATENAGELIDDLTLSFNRARQAAITRELTEIVGGAEALVEH